MTYKRISPDISYPAIWLDGAWARSADLGGDEPEYGELGMYPGDYGILRLVEDYSPLCTGDLVVVDADEALVALYRHDPDAPPPTPPSPARPEPEVLTPEEAEDKRLRAALHAFAGAVVVLAAAGVRPLVIRTCADDDYGCYILVAPEDEDRAARALGADRRDYHAIGSLRQYSFPGGLIEVAG